MNQQQLVMLEHLEELVSYFMSAGVITTESLGRAGEKLSKLSALAFDLKTSHRELSFQDISSF